MARRTQLNLPNQNQTQPQGQPQTQPQASFTTDPADVKRLDEMALKWTNLLRIKAEIKKADKEQANLYKEITKLQGQEAQNAKDYLQTTTNIQSLEKSLQLQKARGNQRDIKYVQGLLNREKAKYELLSKTAGGALRAQEIAAAKQKANLKAEKELIDKINEKRSITTKIVDLFRSKEEKQRRLDMARLRAGGGRNPPPEKPGEGGGAAGGGAGGFSSKAQMLASLGPIGLMAAAIVVAVEKLKAPVKALGKALKDAVVGPLQQVSGLVSGGIGGGYGIGGGAVSGGGATSILSGIQQVVSTIPLIGGVLGVVVGGFKAVADLVLGIDQGITNFARNLGISKAQAKGMKEEYRAIAKTSDSLVVNDTRLMESQVEISKALGIRSGLSRDILENNIKLKQIAGIELETIKAITQTSITQGENADDLTKNVLSQTKAFEFQTGIAFDFRDTLKQTVSQAGVLGLTFTKDEKKLTSMYLKTKAMGFELKQLDGLANSFLDFETSISKEMEAQVLTGKEMNLTAAREAALNNDYATLAAEINKNVGSTTEYLKMNRIQQESIAESVGMSRDALADTLKQQDYYRKLGATNLKQAQEELKILKQKGLTQKEISKQIGEDAYNYITQTSTAERLTEMMNKIKTYFVEFVEKSGILDFITNPEKVEGFMKSLMQRFAGVVDFVGDLIAQLVSAVGTIVGFFDEKAGENLKRTGRSIRTGSSEFASGIRGVAAQVGGTEAPSIGKTVVTGAQATVQAAPAVAGAGLGPVPAQQQQTGVILLDGMKVGDFVMGSNQRSFKMGQK